MINCSKSERMIIEYEQRNKNIADQKKAIGILKERK